jgi:protein-tyrosine phosphatase
VAARPKPPYVLVVCLGNACRSPYAAALLRRELWGGGICVESAGFVGPDRPSPPEAVAVARRRGVDLTAHRSRLLVPDLVRAAGLIVVMDLAQQRAICSRFGRRARDVALLGDFDPETIHPRTVADPVDQPESAFEEVYTRIERCIRELGAVLKRLPRERTA